MDRNRSSGHFILCLTGLALFFCYATITGAETMNYQAYTWVVKGEKTTVNDVADHIVGIDNRASFFVFDNKEVATVSSVVTYDIVKNSGPFKQYATVKFEDGSTITFKSQGIFGGDASQLSSEIVKGTGRFEGIKGTQSSKVKYISVEGDPGLRGYGSGRFEYTLPSK